MAVKIQLQSRKDSKVYDLVVKSRKVIEIIGSYKPEGNYSFLKLNLGRFLYWLKNGAHCSQRILRLIAIK